MPPRTNAFDFTVAIVAGFAGFLLRINGFPLAPIIIGFILGQPLEMSLRQGLVMTDQDFLAFGASPIATFLFALTLFVLLHPLIGPALRALRGRRNAGTDGTNP